MHWLICLLVACDARIPVEQPAPPNARYEVVRLASWTSEASNLGGMHYTFMSCYRAWHGGAHGFLGIEHVLPRPIMGDGEQLRNAFYVAKISHDEVVAVSKPMTSAEANAALAHPDTPYDFSYREPIQSGDLRSPPVPEYAAVKLEAQLAECSNLGGTHYWFTGGGLRLHGGGHGFWSFNGTLSVGRYYVAEIQRAPEPAHPGTFCDGDMPATDGIVLSVIAADSEADARAKLAAIPETGFYPLVQLR